MRILSARIFSKSFGGKIEKFSTDVTYRNKHLKFFLKKKKRRMRILSARIFLSLLAGKLNSFNQMFEETTMTSEQRIFFHQTIRS